MKPKQVEISDCKFSSPDVGDLGCNNHKVSLDGKDGYCICLKIHEKEPYETYDYNLCKYYKMFKTKKNRFFEVWRDVSKDGSYSTRYGISREKLYCQEGYYSCIIIAFGTRDFVFKGRLLDIDHISLLSRLRAWRRGNRDMNGDLIHEGDLVQLIDNDYLGRPIWGSVHKGDDDKLWIKGNHGFSAPLMVQESRIRRVKDKKGFVRRETKLIQGRRGSK